MKIASIQTGIVLLPNDEPLAGFSENPNAKNPIVTLRIRTDDGVEGLGCRPDPNGAPNMKELAGYSPAAGAGSGSSRMPATAKTRTSRRMPLASMLPRSSARTMSRTSA